MPSQSVTFIGCVGVSFTNPDQEKTRQGMSWRVRGDCIVGSKGNLATQLHNSTRRGASNLTEGRTAQAVAWVCAATATKAD